MVADGAPPWFASPEDVVRGAPELGDELFGVLATVLLLLLLPLLLKPGTTTGCGLTSGGATVEDDAVAAALVLPLPALMTGSWAADEGVHELVTDVELLPLALASPVGSATPLLLLLDRLNWTAATDVELGGIFAWDSWDPTFN